jgi:hypothetical protein
MISRQEWDRYSDERKWDYLFHHSGVTEQNMHRIGATLQVLQDRLAKVEASLQAGGIVSPPPQQNPQTSQS